MPLVFLSSATPAAELAITGRWSPYSLLILFVMAFISLAMLAVFFILLLSARFRRGPAATPPATAGPVFELPQTEAEAGEEEPLPDNLEELYQDIPDDLPAKRESKLWPLVSRIAGWFAGGTGLWQCLLAIALGPLAALCTLGLENMYGRMVGFTDCTLLLLLMLAAQITMIVLLWRRQRGRGR